MILNDIRLYLEPVDHAAYQRAATTVRAQLAEDTFVAAWAAGRALTLEQAVAEAMAVEGAVNS